ncbi:hypothetical protein, partial [Salmonella sp. s51228]|uniref:hypothetical protein n=1 Tax=Salmonella sp. s51228 TaxID=3159652 RepID=UPI0039817FC6
MKKLWTNVMIGRDMRADCIFYFHQELPKFLRGYHRCSTEEAVHLAALIYRVRFGDDQSKMTQLQRTLEQFVPVDMVGKFSGEDLKRQIASALTKAPRSKDDAKVAFL